MIEGGYWGSSGSDEGITTAIRRREEDTERRSSEQGWWKLEADYFLGLIHKLRLRENV